MATKMEARAAVDAIAKEYGFIGDDIMAKIEAWQPEIRRIIEEGMLAKDKKMAHSIKTLAQNLYGSDARFVFELLQNSDDNKFSRAKASGALPFVSFQVHPDRIIVECNEDGFTVENLNAICSVGESTKSASHGYIGAKGIGFKSVFIAAWKVEIQSGNFSFYFKHEQGDLGLGMVLPVWKEAKPSGLEGPLTRMTLHLHQKGDPDQLQNLRTTIFGQLEDLQHTCLLFLHNLRQIRVSFHDEEGRVKTSKEFSVKALEGHRLDLEIVAKDKNVTVATTKSHYHVTRYKARNLSRSVGRQLSAAEGADHSGSSAEVVLAFPLTDDTKPLIDRQEMFAFLPVRESAFKFIIQSDFDTTASRQDILATSARNVDLRNGIAAAFAMAVVQFCEDPDLCYTWPLFLPMESDALGDFWHKLREQIRGVLSKEAILKSRYRVGLQKIGNVVDLTGDARDSQGNPLLDDPETDPFLSDHYPSSCKEALKQYGLRKLHFELFLELLNKDLANPWSRIKATPYSDVWHSKMSQCLRNLFARGSNERKAQLKSVPMLPLCTGAWTSANLDQVYLPTTKGIQIPSGTGMRIVDPAATANLERCALFMDLGVSELPVFRVRAEALKGLRSSPHTLDVEQSKDHLRYLYQSDQYKPAKTTLDSIFLYDHNEDVEKPKDDDFYLPSDHPYGPSVLLAQTDTAPGLNVRFVHPSYLEDHPAPWRLGQKSWMAWLVEEVGVRERLPLVYSSIGDTSLEWDYVHKHRPDKLLGMLEYLWKYEGTEVLECQLQDKISSTDATELCKGRPPHDEMLLLRSTWLPVTSLEKQCRNFMEEDEFFPFLELPDAKSQDLLLAKWAFLHSHLGVEKDHSTSLLLDILKWIKAANGDAKGISRPTRVWDLYAAIDATHLLCMEGEKEEDISNISYSFKSIRGVLVPACVEQEAEWAEPGDCLWEAPSSMQTKHPLKSAFTQVLGAENAEKMDLLSHFFQRTLSVKDATCDDLIKELSHLREVGCDDSDRMLDLYEYLEQTTDDSSSGRLRVLFEAENLIFVSKNGDCGWYKASQCLWSSAAEIRGHVTISDQYEDLKDFFVDIVGVKTLTLRMVYDELLQATSTTPRDHVKNTVMTFASLLESDITDDVYNEDGQEPKLGLDPKRLIGASMFPIRHPNGDKALVSGKVDFAIANRKLLAEKFSDRIKTLDYNLTEVTRLMPFFKWLGVERRCMSEMVREFTSISTGCDQRPVTVPQYDLKYKAHAILRIAATNNSPRYHADPASLYRLLRTIKVIETTGLSSVLRIMQDGQAVDFEMAMGDNHLTEGVSGDVEADASAAVPSQQLTVYVPMDRKNLHFCFLDALPKRLEDWLMRDASTQIRRCDRANQDVVHALVQILSAKLSVLDRVLDSIGAVPVDHIRNEDEQLPDEDEDDNVPAEHNVNEDEQPREDVDNAGNDHVHDSRREEESDSEDATLTEGRSHMAYHHSRVRYTPSLITVDQEDMQYGELLKRVVTAARAATFPSKGSFDMSALRNALPSADVAAGFASFNGIDTVGSRFRSSSQIKRDKKIGAAGELFVFELLSRLDPRLSRWSKDNWQSTIRKYVTIHSDYADLREWNGRETADITYQDTEGDLTAVLADRGYVDLQDRGWQGARPKYFIEVKTTTGPCQTPFFMSKYQYNRMRDVHNRAQRSVISEVYIIMRVFNVESRKPGVCVYLDPEQMRLNGMLEFTGETWSVVPGDG